MRRVGALAVVLLFVSGAEARPPVRRRVVAPPPAAPATHGATSQGLLALRAPGPREVFVRAGSFLMGSTITEVAEAVDLCKAEPLGESCDEMVLGPGMTRIAPFGDEHAPREVYLDDFWIDRTEVTVARYRQCVASGRCDEPPYAEGAERFDRPELPVVLVTWHDASRFCAWAGGRLPTEAEWERAARGILRRRYPWGNVYNPHLSNHGRLALDPLDPIDGFVELAPVGSHRDGRTPDGIDDLAGNVEEWVGDWYSPQYPQTSEVNPTGPSSGDERVLRGGGYESARPWLRGAARGNDGPGVRRTWRGFRCARPG